MRPSNQKCMESVMKVFKSYLAVDREQTLTTYVGKSYADSGQIWPKTWTCYEFFDAKICLSPYDAQLSYQACAGDLI